MPARILALVAMAFVLAGCRPHSDTSDPAAPIGLIGAFRQFLELDSPPESSIPIVRASVTPGGRSSRPVHAGLAAEVDRVADQIRAVYGDASSFMTGFPSAEDAYRNIPAKFTEQLNRIRENKTNADAATIGRRLSQLSDQANSVLERQHTRFTTLQSNFNQKLETATKNASDIEKRCAQIHGPTEAPQDQIQACSKFYDANSMIKAKAELVTAGFSRLDQAYEETRATLQDLASQATATPAKK